MSLKQSSHAAVRYMGLGFEFIGYIAVPAALGYVADRYLFGSPAGWGFIAGTIIGFIYGIFRLYRQAVSMSHELKSESYTKPLSDEERIAGIRSGLNRVGEQIDRFSNRHRK